MFKSRKILYAKEWNTRNLINLKPRYIIVLHNDGLLISFCTPTKADSVPDILKKEGCIYDEANNIHCFHFPEKKIVGENNFAFPKDTYMYIAIDVFSKEMSKINEFANNGIITEIDTLNEKDFIELIYCIYKSKFLNRGIKRKLESLISVYYDNNALS